MSEEHHYGTQKAAASDHYSIQDPQPHRSLHYPSVSPQHLPAHQQPYGYREVGSGYTHRHHNNNNNINNNNINNINNIINNNNNHQQNHITTTASPAWTMNGVAGGHHPFPGPVPSAPRGPAQNGAHSWAYGSQLSTQEAAQPPPPSHYNQTDSWNKPVPFARSQPHDGNYPHPHLHSYNSQNFSRPLHNALEPSAAPSPPNQYPPSPRAVVSTGQAINSNGLPAPQPFRQPNRPSLGSSTGLASPAEHRPEIVNYAESNQSSPSSQSLPSRHPGRGSMVSPLGPPASTNGHRASMSYNNAHRNTDGYVPQQQGGADDDGRVAERPSTTPTALRNYGSEYDSTDDDRRIKRERNSCTPGMGMSMSPGTATMMDGSDRSPSYSGSMKDSKGNGLELPKKKGLPVFHDQNGVEYYENEPVPAGVEVPPGWQIGTGKQTKGLLLPQMKDGIQVNPEWGFTAGGKARQRLPQACRNCRAKKIRCVESDHDETICQHCMKMRISCQRYEKDDDKKKKRGSSSHDHIKSENGGERSVSITSDSMDMMHAPGKNGSKKRKSVEDNSNGIKKINRGPDSRANSMVGDLVNTTLANASPSSRRQEINSAPPLDDERPPLFPTNPMDAAATGHDRGDSRGKHVRELRENFSSSRPQDSSQPQDVHGHYRSSSMSDTSPLSYASQSPVITPVQAMSMTSGGGGYIEHHGYPDSRHRALSSSAPVTPMSVPHPMGEDSRNLCLPGPEVLHHLMDAYFANIYSQTYAFLHKSTFMANMDKHPPVLLFSMCAVAARFSKFRGYECEWEERARELILRDYDKYSLEMVQSMVHMGLHDFGSNNSTKAWMFAGMAVRMGAALNMNLENRKSEKGKDAIVRECTRRTYWSYYLMDRFNSYGVARPFLTQDHDCHIQLPCNQPSFDQGKYVPTEHLLGANPYSLEVGAKYMGAMAYLVRVVGIWGNILKQIHLSAFQTCSPEETKGKATNGFNHFIEKLEDWRKTLPPGLEYSNENLAGQIRVGTTGAFVTMHVMWHTAMAYVHRYVRTVGVPQDFIKQNIKGNVVVESIRKAFVHADAVLQIMFHVRQQRELARSNNESNVTVNAPFLGQAISDACNITVIRALEFRGEPGRVNEQRLRVWVGLDWLRELRRYWKPIEGMYQKLKKRCKPLEKSVSQPPSVHMVPTPESSVDSGLQPGTQYPVDPDNYTAEPTFTSGAISQSMEMLEFPQFTDFLSTGTIPLTYFGAAFAAEASQYHLSEYARNEGGFPDLYPYTDSHLENVSAPYSYDVHASSILGGGGVVDMMPMPIDQTGSAAPTGSFEVGNNQDDNELDTSDNEDEDENDTQQGRSKKENINAMYFDPTAVRDGTLQDSSSETSAYSRRQSYTAVTKAEGNPMDLFRLINQENMDGINAGLQNRQNNRDEFTGPGGAAAPDNNEFAGQPNLDNSGTGAS